MSGKRAWQSLGCDSLHQSKMYQMYKVPVKWEKHLKKMLTCSMASQQEKETNTFLSIIHTADLKFNKLWTQDPSAHGFKSN